MFVVVYVYVFVFVLVFFVFCFLGIKKTALIYALQGNNIPAMEFLLDQKININLKDRDGMVYIF